MLIAGERGSGKRTVAELIHRRGRRCLQPLHSIDCATLPLARAARILGVDRKTLYRKLQQYGSQQAADAD